MDVSLFEPSMTGREMRNIYPELKNYDEFNDLSDKELQMCWFIGHSRSPAHTKYPGTSNDDKKNRIKFAISQSFEKEYIERSKDLRSFYEGNSVPQKYQVAIKRFATFDIGSRLRLRFINMTMLSNLEKMIYIEEDDWDDLSGSDYKDYAATAKSILELMPKIQENLEGGYGLKIKEPESNARSNQRVEHKVKVSINEV